MNWASVLICLFFLMAPFAWAGPPFVIDDPETSQWHGWEINIPFTYEHTRDQRGRDQ